MQKRRKIEKASEKELEKGVQNKELAVVECDKSSALETLRSERLYTVREGLKVTEAPTVYKICFLWTITQ